MNLNDESKSTIQGIQSVEHAFFILDTIKESSQPLTLSEISHATNMSKSRVQKYVISFLRLGALVQNEKDHTYSFGPKLIEFGLHSLQRYDIIELSEPYLKEIKRELNQSSALNVWTQTGPVVVKSEPSDRPISVGIQVGYRPPLYKSSTGKCFAAFLDSSEVEDLIDSEAQHYDLDRKEIKKELEDIRENGYSFRDTIHEGIPGGAAITCPVFDNSEHIIAAISIIGFSESINTEAHSKDVQKLKELTSGLSQDLQYS
ncbi:IclR family transcriptional regulator [Lentibacillus halophilus]|uniref:IclR family transcriptional regulator n=1 Tax=Lentibacillus halophilus TaxID=295065 RepID=A0ABN0ZIM1_9BACI